MAEEAKWYVVHTYSGYENKVADSIVNAVENRQLHHLITDVKIPTEMVVEIKDDGQKVEKEQKLFPSYVFGLLTSPRKFVTIGSHSPAMYLLR